VHLDFPVRGALRRRCPAAPMVANAGRTYSDLAYPQSAQQLLVYNIMQFNIIKLKLYSIWHKVANYVHDLDGHFIAVIFLS
jgi:hypothetical protein